MGTAIADLLQTFSADLTTVATAAFAVGGVALLAWLGWRLACKIPNRGVGK